MKFLNFLRALNTFYSHHVLFIQLLFAAFSFNSVATPSFVLVCHQATKEELCQRYLNQHKEVISYSDYLESSTGLLPRSLFLRINQFLELYHKIPANIDSDVRKATSYFTKKSQLIENPHALSPPPNGMMPFNDPLNEIHQELINDLTQGFLSPIKKSILLHLLTLQQKGTTVPFSPSNSFPDSTPASPKMPLTNPLLPRDWELQIKTLRDGPFAHPGTLSPHFELPHHMDRIYLNGILIRKEQFSRLQFHPHIYYHVSYVSNTYQPRFEWVLGEKLQSHGVNVPIAEGDCSNPLWRANETDYPINDNDKIKILYPSNCLAQITDKVSVFNFKNEPSRKLDSSINGALKNELVASPQSSIATIDDFSKSSVSETLKNTWHEHPIMIWGSSLLAFYFISKQIPTDSH